MSIRTTRLRSRLVVAGACAALVALLVPAGSALAISSSDFSVTPATGGTNIPAATAGGAWTSLSGPVISVAPSQTADLITPAVPIVLSLPANFAFNSQMTTAPTLAPAGCNLTVTSVTYSGTGSSATSAQIGVAGTHDSTACTITFSSLQVRPISSSASAGTGGTIAVTAGGTSIGSGGAVTMAVPSVPPVVTPATGGTNIPYSSAGGTYTTLSGPTITEGTAGQLSASTIVLALPANFVFDSGSTTAPSTSCGYPVSAISYFGAGSQPTNAQISLTGHATMSVCAISFGTLLRVRPVSPDPAAGTGGTISVSVDGNTIGSGGTVSMTSPPPGTLTLSITSPTLNNNAIIWGQSYIDIRTSGTPGTTFGIQASTDNSTWVPLKNSSGAVLSWTIGSSGSSTYRYTPIRNYWYKSVAGATVSNVVRITVRQTCSISPSHSGTVSLAAGSKITFTTTSRPARSDLPTANVTFQIYQKSSSGSWVLHSSVTKPINSAGQVSWPVTFSTKGSFYVRAQTQPTSVNSNSFWTPNQYYTVG